jgi:predicted permease
MRTFRAAAVRVRSLVQRRTADAELDEELRYHLDRDVERRMANGESRQDAIANARRAFGNVTVHTEAARNASRMLAIEQFVQDVRFGLRELRHTPRFVLAVTLTIGLGIGLLTAAFTIFDAYVLRLVAVRDPKSLYELELRDRFGRIRNASLRDFESLSRANPALTDAFAYRPVFARRDGAPLMLQLVSGNFFDMLGVRAALGRTLSPDDDATPNGSPTLVMSYRTWVSKYGSDSSVVGQRLRIRDRSFEIVGVAREGFDGLKDVPPDFWVPTSMLSTFVEPSQLNRSNLRDEPLIRIIGRVDRGLSQQSAERRLSQWAATATMDWPERDRISTVTLESRATATFMTPETMAELSPLFLAFALVLVIACANVANLMLARGMARQTEIGIRIALGAARARIVRQLLVEALLLAVQAGVVCYVIARLMVTVGVAVMLATVPQALAPYIRVISLTPDAWLFGFVFACALASAIGFGLVPALQSTRTDVVAATRGEFVHAWRPDRARNALVIGQITVCSLLLVSAGVLVRNAARLGQLNVGYSTLGLVEAIPPNAIRSAVIDRLRALPGVTSLTVAREGPFDGRFSQVAALPGPTAPVVSAGTNLVSPAYFETLRIRIVRGRAFSDDDVRSGEAVAVISEGAANTFWPNADPIGATLRISSIKGDDGTPPKQVRVIGVAANVVGGFIGERLDHPTIYQPAPIDLAGGTLLITTNADAAVAKETIRRLLAPIDPEEAVELRTVEEALTAQVYPFRAARWISLALGAIALFLTATGVYGVLAYVVALRRKEIGIRMALGATGVSIVALVVRQSARLAAIGVVAGSLMALGAGRFVSSRLPLIPSFDAVALVGGAIIVLFAALGAAYVPSRRAATVNPSECLKS